MKLNKKRISILVSLMCLLVLFVFTLCSFSLPTIGSTAPSILSFTFGDCENLLSIMQLQDVCGSLNSFVPVYCTNSNNFITLYLVRFAYKDSFTVTPYSDGSGYSIRGGGTYYIMTLSGGGFSFLQQYGSPSGVGADVLLFYRPSYNDDFIINSSYAFSSSTPDNDFLIDLKDYWIEFYERLTIDYSEEFESYFDAGYFDGLVSGLEWGEELGYQIGYTDGVGTGYRDGYLAGEAEGYETGYFDGYQNGYETGYDSGYSEAERETVIEYVEPVELDIPGIFNSIGAVPRQVLHGVDFDIFGVPILGVLLSILVLTISIFVIRKIK